MQYRQLGRSGLRISVIALGTMTYGGRGAFAKTGAVDLAGVRRQIDMCLEAGVNLIDEADIYSTGLSEELVGEALKGQQHGIAVHQRREQQLSLGQNTISQECFTQHAVFAPRKPMSGRQVQIKGV